MEEEHGRFQILSLDGGGIKGLFSAAVLASIEEDLDIRIQDHFDLIAGTSTGGIIALGLGIGLRPREIVEFYHSKGPSIFNKMWGVRSLQHWIRRKFPQKTLHAELGKVYGGKKLSDCTKRLVIPSYSLTDDDVYIFRTPHHERLRRDYKVALSKIALATSAAPTYFPACKHIGHMRLIDGGVWANNPTMVAIVEAYGTLDVPLENIKVFSIGTSNAITHRQKKLDRGGKLRWAKGNDAIDIIMRGQSLSANNQANFLLGKENVMRWDPNVAVGEFSLDGAGQVDDLIGKAAHFSRIHMPDFKDVFTGHAAAEYQPLYT